MKIPEHLFVSHCPNLSPERKVFLLEHFKDRVDIKDIRWFEDYNYDHPLVEWIQYTKKPPYGPKLTSNMLRGLFRCKTMVDENIECAILMDDDAVFHKDWKEILDSVELQPNVLFVNLGLPQFQPNIKPKKNTIYQLNNNGGCEVAYVTLQFAKSFLTHFSFLHGGDIIIHGLLHSIKHPMLCVPVCTQTSTLVRVSTLDHETKSNELINWVDTVINYGKIKHENFYNILEDYEKYKKTKEEKEDKFYELYGQKVDIKNVGFVLVDNNNMNDIIQFD